MYSCCLPNRCPISSPGAPEQQTFPAVHILRQNRRVVLQWNPTHCGTLGNENADVLAKEGVQTEQAEDGIY